MTDVVVAGATGAGIAAAEAGAATVLVDRGRHVGGMVSGGLSWTDVGDQTVDDPAEFALLDRLLEAVPDMPLLGLVHDLLPNGKCDVNSVGPFSLNVLDGSNLAYLDGDREAVLAHHLRYTQSLLWHQVERTWRLLPEYERTPAVFNEGYLSVAVPPYPIPYRSLTPRREDAADVLVPVCLSASHVAFASVRMEPTPMMLGHAAGAAAAQAARRGVAVQDVDVDELQRALRDDGAVLAA